MVCSARTNLDGRFLLPLLLVWLGAAAFPAWPAPEAGEEVAIHLQFLATRPGHPAEGDGVYGPTEQKASGDVRLRYGETGYVFLGAGSFDDSGRAVASNVQVQSMSGGVRSGEAWSPVRGKLLGHAPVAWWVEVTPRKAEFGKVRLDVRWERLESDRRGETAVARSGARSIAMLESQSHVLDFLPGDAGDDGERPGDVLIRLAAEIREDPGLESVPLRYSLWLRHRSHGKDVPARRILLVAHQGEEATFRFLPMRFRLGDARGRDGMPLEVVMEVSGSVLGRSRSDGSVEVRLSGGRTIGLARKEDARAGGIGWNGVKVFAVSPGESVALEFPPPEGRVAMDAGEDGVVLADFFAGSDTAVILTVDTE